MSTQKSWKRVEKVKKIVFESTKTKIVKKIDILKINA